MTEYSKRWIDRQVMILTQTSLLIKDQKHEDNMEKGTAGGGMLYVPSKVSALRSSSQLQ